jgi:hypothetical protein
MAQNDVLDFPHSEVLVWWLGSKKVFKTVIFLRLGFRLEIKDFL